MVDKDETAVYLINFKVISMFSNYNAIKQSNPTSTIGAYQQRDQAQAIMGFKGVQHSHTAECECGKREVFDPKTIQMPKMVVKNAPVINPWYGLQH